jgi:hypothetical protein
MNPRYNLRCSNRVTTGSDAYSLHIFDEQERCYILQLSASVYKAFRKICPRLQVLKKNNAYTIFSYLKKGILYPRTRNLFK